VRRQQGRAGGRGAHILEREESIRLPAGKFRLATYYDPVSYFPFYDHPKRNLLAKAVSYTFNMPDAGLADPRTLPIPSQARRSDLLR
jgi:hypothetical protein